MSKHFFLSTALSALLITFPVKAQEATPPSEMPAGLYELDLGHASLVWKVSHLGLSDYTARFIDFDAELDFDPANPENSSLSVTVDPMSIETEYPGEKDFDKELSEGENWFNAGEFPEITFQSTAIEKNGENTGTLTGDLTFLGVTKPLVLDVTFNKALNPQPFSNKPTLGFSATGSLKRSEWGMDTYVGPIGDEVELLIEAEFAKAEE